jgi:hypothetical protein
MTLHLLPLLTTLAIANALLPAALSSIYQHSFIDALLSGFGQSFVIWLSLIVSVLLWKKSAVKPTVHKPSVYVCAVLLSFSLLIPLATINWLTCAGCSLIWLRQYRNDQFARAAALLILATSLREPVTKLLLTLFADQILSLDTWLTFLSLSYFNNTNFSVQNNLISQEGSYGLLILTGCSAFVNLSLALLLWLALSLLQKYRLNRADIAIACVLGVSIVALNTFRLSLMAIDQYWYQLLHQGNGALAIELTIFLLASLPFLWRRYYEKTDSNTDNYIASPTIGAFNQTDKTPVK